MDTRKQQAATKLWDLFVTHGTSSARIDNLDCCIHRNTHVPVCFQIIVMDVIGEETRFTVGVSILEAS